MTQERLRKCVAYLREAHTKLTTGEEGLRMALPDELVLTGMADLLPHLDKIWLGIGMVQGVLESLELETKDEA